MRKVIIILQLCISFISYAGFSQCNISRSTLSDGSKQFLAKSEEVFKNKRFDLGIQFAMTQLEVDKHPTNPDLMSFSVLIVTVNSKSFPDVVPRFLEIRLSNGEVLSLTAESARDTRYIENAKVFTSSFDLGIDNFAKLAKNSVNAMRIVDNRNGQSLAVTDMYRDLLKEQAICLANAVKN